MGAERSGVHRLAFPLLILLEVLKKDVLLGLPRTVHQLGVVFDALGVPALDGLFQGVLVRR